MSEPTAVIEPLPPAGISRSPRGRRPLRRRRSPRPRSPWCATASAGTPSSPPGPAGARKPPARRAAGRRRRSRRRRRRERRRLGRPHRQLAPVEDAERAGGHAVAAAVADVRLDDDGAVLGSEQRAGRADVEAGRVRAVLADVRAHQPAEGVARVRGRVDARLVAVEAERLALLDERDVAPRVRAQLGRVVVRLARPDTAVVGDQVPFLAGHLAGLAADADRGVREEAHPGLRLVAVGVRPGGRLAGDRGRAQPGASCSGSTRGRARADRACARRSSMYSLDLAPCGRRPARMSQVKALTSWMCTFGSSAMCDRSFAAPPVVRPRWPQWYGSPTWCTTRPSTRTGRTRSVTSTRASIAARAVTTCAQPPCVRPRSRARSG